MAANSRWTDFVRFASERITALGADPAVVLDPQPAQQRMRAMISGRRTTGEYLSVDVGAEPLADVSAQLLAETFVDRWRRAVEQPRS